MNQIKANSVEESIELGVDATLRAAARAHRYKPFALRTLTYEQLCELDVERALTDKLLSEDEESSSKLALPDDFETEWFASVGAELRERRALARLLARQCISQSPPHVQADGSVCVGSHTLAPLASGLPYVHLAIEGESKRLYRLLLPAADDMAADFAALCFIKLKSTIFSHTHQRTGEIRELASVRAHGSQLLLDVLQRNHIEHAYRCVSQSGLVLARLVDDLPPLEIIIKRFCVGTDQRTMHGLVDERAAVQADNAEYLCGPYVRFDWRNPNHVERAGSGRAAMSSPYFFVVEELLGKDRFFAEIVRGGAFRPMGDTSVCEALLGGLIDCDAVRETALKVFLSLQAWLARCSPPLVIQDNCIMTDRSGAVVWSEINSDCMRIKARDDRSQAFDKDIWRRGGADSKQAILRRWRAFNDIVGRALRQSPFQADDMFQRRLAFQAEARRIVDDRRLTAMTPLYRRLYAQLARGGVRRDAECNIGGSCEGRRRVILSIDVCDGKPTAVAMRDAAVFEHVRLVDADGKSAGKALRELAAEHGGQVLIDATKQKIDTEMIRQNHAENVCFAVGADIDDDVLASISANAVVALCVDSELNVVNGDNKSAAKQVLQRLADSGVTRVSISFASPPSESLFPHRQAETVLRLVPKTIDTVMFCDVASLSDAERLWSLGERVVPQVNAATLWQSNSVEAGEWMSSMLRFEQQHTLAGGELLAPAVVQEKSGRVCCFVWVNSRAVASMTNDRVFSFFSLALQTVCREENVKVERLILDDDSGSLLIRVQTFEIFGGDKGKRINQFQ